MTGVRREGLSLEHSYGGQGSRVAELRSRSHFLSNVVGGEDEVEVVVSWRMAIREWRVSDGAG